MSLAGDGAMSSNININEWFKSWSKAIMKGHPGGVAKTLMLDTPNIKTSDHFTPEGFTPKIEWVGWDLGTNNQSRYHKIYMDNGQLIVSEINETELYKTKIELAPTTQLVFECCKCGVIHNPETISFQTLVYSSKAAGWSIKWHDKGYDVMCKECLSK